MSKSELLRRMAHSSEDFRLGVKAQLEEFLGITIHSIENEKEASELARHLDQAGIDAYYFNQAGVIRGLASRVQYGNYVRTCPTFSLRFALFDQKRHCWDEDREYKRKHHAANAPEQFIFFPKLHVESWSSEKGSGKIGWSFATETKDLVNYIHDYAEDETRVRIYSPKYGERRRVVEVYVEKYALERPIIPIQSQRLN